MESLIEKVTLLRDRCRDYGDRLGKLLAVSTDASDPRVGCFAMVFNHSTLALELLSYYRRIWQRPRGHSTADEIEQARMENWQRCNELCKGLFVMSMSSIEYSTKASIAYYGDGHLALRLVKKKGRFLYLSHIMTNSEREGLVHASAKLDWDRLIDIRNCVVHNNAIADQTEDYVIGGINVVTTKGKMLQGKLDFFATLTEVAVDLYFEWITALVQRSKA